jgi:hypothetical protein
VKVRLADGADHNAVPLTPGTLVMEPPETSDTSVWVVEAGGRRRKLTFAEFVAVFPQATDSKDERAAKRDAFVQRVPRALLDQLADTNEVMVPIAPASPPPAPTTLAHSKLERLQAAVIRVYAAGGKAEGLPVDLDSLRQRMVDAPRAVIEDKIRHFNNWADMQSNAPAVTIHAPEPPSISTPPVPVQPPGDYMSGNIYISSPELSDWSSRSGSIRGHMQKWIDEKLKAGHGAHHELGVDLGDQRELDKLHDWLEVLESNDKQLHLWAQGDQEHRERGQPRADWNRLLNRTENLADVIENYPGTVSVGVGFDTFEWVPLARGGHYSRFHEWVDEMRSLVPWLLVGGRPQGAWATNDGHVLSTEQAAQWNSHSTYYSIEGGVVTEGFIREVKTEANRMGLPVMSENRDRLGNTEEDAPGMSHGYSYSEGQLAATVRWYRRYRVAGIIANWRNRATRDHPRATRELPASVYTAIEAPLGGD